MSQAIESVEGVRYARVAFTDNKAEVQSDSCNDAVFESISDALHGEGYGGTVVSVEPLESDERGGTPPHAAP